MSGRPESGVELLRQLPVLSACLEEPKTRRELTDSIDNSRSTIYRITINLEERGLLTNVDGGYRTTAQGTAFVSMCEGFLSGIDVIEDLEPLFERVSHPELLANAHLLTEPTVTVADADNPYRVVDLVVDRFERTATSRGTIANVTATSALEGISGLDDKDSFERIFTASALESHRAVGGDAFTEVSTHDALSLLVADDDVVPFSFAIDDDAVTIVGHDQQIGLPTVHVSTNSDHARMWLETLYARCRAAATTVQAKG